MNNERPSEDDPYYDEIIQEQHEDQLIAAFFAGVGIGIALGALIVVLGMWIL